MLYIKAADSWLWPYYFSSTKLAWSRLIAHMLLLNLDLLLSSTPNRVLYDTVNDISSGGVRWCKMALAVDRNVSEELWW